MVGSKSKGTLTRETETWCRRLVEDRVVRRGREVRREEERREEKKKRKESKIIIIKIAEEKRDEKKKKKRNEHSKRTICHVSNGIAR